jgi:hypothetical protein
VVRHRFPIIAAGSIKLGAKCLVQKPNRCQEGVLLLVGGRTSARAFAHVCPYVFLEIGGVFKAPLQTEAHILVGGYIIVGVKVFVRKMRLPRPAVRPRLFKLVCAFPEPIANAT